MDIAKTEKGIISQLPNGFISSSFNSLDNEATIGKFPDAKIKTLLQNSNFASTEGWVIGGNATGFIVSGHIGNLTLSGANNTLSQYVTLRAGHTYYAAAILEGIAFKTHIYITNSSTDSNLGVGTLNSSGNYTLVSCIAQIGAGDVSGRIQIGSWQLDSTEYPSNLYMRSACLIDLSDCGLLGLSQSSIDSIVYSDANKESIMAGSVVEVKGQYPASYSNSASRNSWIKDYQIYGNTILDASRETTPEIKNIFPNPDFSDAASWTLNGVTFSKTGDNSATMTISTSAAGIYARTPAFTAGLKRGHAVLFYCYLTSSVTTTRTRVLLADSRGRGGAMFIGSLTAGVRTRVSGWMSELQYVPSNVWFTFDDSVAHAEGSTILIESPVLIDFNDLTDANYDTMCPMTNDGYNDLVAAVTNYDSWETYNEAGLMSGKTFSSPNPNIYESLLGRCDYPYEMTSTGCYANAPSFSPYGVTKYWLKANHRYLLVAKSDGGAITGSSLVSSMTQAGDGVSYATFGMGSYGYQYIGLIASGWSSSAPVTVRWCVMIDLTQYGMNALTAEQAFLFFKTLGYGALASGKTLGVPRDGVFPNLLGSQNTMTTISDTSLGSKFIIPLADGGFTKGYYNTVYADTTAPGKKIFIRSGHTYWFCCARTVTDDFVASDYNWASAFYNGTDLIGYNTDGVNDTNAKTSYREYFISKVTSTYTGAAMPVFQRCDLTAFDGVYQGMCVLDLTELGYSAYTAKQVFNLLETNLDSLFSGNLVRYMPDLRSLGDGKVNLYDPSVLELVAGVNFTGEFIDDRLGFKMTCTTAKTASGYSAAGFKLMSLSSFGLKGDDKFVMYSNIENRTLQNFHEANHFLVKILYYKADNTYIGADIESASITEGPTFITGFVVPSAATKAQLLFITSSVDLFALGESILLHDIAIFKVDSSYPGAFNYAQPYAPHYAHSLTISNKGRNRAILSKIMAGTIPAQDMTLKAYDDNSVTFTTTTSSGSGYYKEKINISDIGLEPGSSIVFHSGSYSYTGTTTPSSVVVGLSFLNSSDAIVYTTAPTIGAISQIVIPSDAVTMIVSYQLVTNQSGVDITFKGLYLGYGSISQYVYEPARKDDDYPVDMPYALECVYPYNYDAMMISNYDTSYDFTSYNYCKMSKGLISVQYTAASGVWKVSSNGQDGYYELNPAFFADAIASTSPMYVIPAACQAQSVTATYAGTAGMAQVSNVGGLRGHLGNPDKTQNYYPVAGKAKSGWSADFYPPDVRLYDNTSNILSIGDVGGLRPRELDYEYWADRPEV